MLHTLAVAVHALAATVALAAGVVALPAGRGYGLYRAALAVAAAALPVALAAGWATTEPVLRAVFAGLVVLAAVVVVRGVRAGAHRPGPGRHPDRAWLGHVGFTLVALVDGFLVVTALRLGVTGAGLLALGAGVAAVGHLLVRGAQHREHAPARAPARAPA